MVAISTFHRCLRLRQHQPYEQAPRMQQRITMISRFVTVSIVLSASNSAVWLGPLSLKGSSLFLTVDHTALGDLKPNEFSLNRITNHKQPTHRRVMLRGRYQWDHRSLTPQNACLNPDF